ncbi:cobalamin B12-binding domain-containing protein [Paraburkholderia rhynchosiae]|uniref:Cobalamin-binding protein n=1 Tax=Paraburkholderia rhynchosiae TaxID=487049 RepID=A0A2N7W555_9BURK|nr:cobalamin-dependent protein [Paraburkholderia rhynchosiae]PMS24525.1 cobalamin-binding protein [Paraburkholderia rhynchosiae]CAB3735674.1 Pivalyl-CoA mutase small subunit [Paraburkholderia rhynchosiae]
MTGERKIRCLLGMLGTDVHTKGIRTLAQLFRDNGIEVVYLGEHNTVDGMVNAVIQEDVDLVGISFSIATYLHYAKELIDAMRARGVDHVPVMVGGLVHPDDHEPLRKLGVSGIFGPGSTTPEILAFVHSACLPPVQ